MTGTLEPTRSSGSSTVIIGVAAWVRWLVAPALTVTVALGALAVGGVEPSGGGWPGMLAVVGGFVVVG